MYFKPQNPLTNGGLEHSKKFFGIMKPCFLRAWGKIRVQTYENQLTFNN
jgi:hypothetical protein